MSFVVSNYHMLVNKTTHWSLILNPYHELMFIECIVFNFISRDCSNLLVSLADGAQKFMDSLSNDITTLWPSLAKSRVGNVITSMPKYKVAALIIF